MAEPAGWRVALETALALAVDGGVPPGEVVQHLLEQAHVMPRKPCGEGEDGGKCRVTTVDEATGEIRQRVMGPKADYVLLIGPKYELAGAQVYGTTGTTNLTIKRRSGG